MREDEEQKREEGREMRDETQDKEKREETEIEKGREAEEKGAEEEKDAEVQGSRGAEEKEMREERKEIEIEEEKEIEIEKGRGKVVGMRKILEYLKKPLGEEPKAIGIDIGTRYVKIAQVKKELGTYVLEKCGAIELLPDIIVDREVMDRESLVENIKHLIEESGIEGRKVSTFIAGKNVILKKLEAKMPKRKEFPKLVEKLAQENIPFDLKEVIIDYKKLSEQPDKIEFLLIGAKREFIYPLIDILKEVKLLPYNIDIPPFALKTVYEKNNYIEKEGAYLLINIGFEHTFVIGVKDGRYLFDDEVSFGVRSFVEEVQRICNISAKDAELILSGKEIEGEAPKDVTKPIDNTSKRLISRIERILPSRVSEWNKVIIGGGGAHISGFKEALGASFNTECEIGNPLKELECETTLPEVPELFDLAIGLAISKLEKTNANLLPIEERISERSKFLIFLELWLPIYVPAFVALLCGIIGLNLTHKKGSISQEIKSMEQQQRDLAPRVAEIKELIRKESATSKKIKVIQELNTHKYTRIKLLDEINLLLPKYTWLIALNELSIDSIGVNILVHGITTDNFAVSNFMRRLENAPHFDNVDLSYTQREEIGETETTEFEIKMRFSE